MDMTVSRFTERHAPSPEASIEVDGFSLRRYQRPLHFPTLNAWLCKPYARFWGMTELTDEERAEALADLPGKFGMLGFLGNQPAFYIELYDPRDDEVGQHYSPQPGDCGMHILLAPAERPVHGFSHRAMAATMEFILGHLKFSRVVVEPDAGNDKIHRLNHSVGIHYAGEIQLSHKRACLGFAGAEDFGKAVGRD